MKAEKHLLVKKYLEQHSLVESNVRSFNDFIKNKMQQIVNEINDNLSHDEVEIKFGKIRIGKPNITEADGSVSAITPVEAKLRTLTYSAPIHAEISVNYGENSDSSEVEIGRIPVIVRSDICNTYGMSKEELRENYMDPLDPGGYFIINGNERIMVMTEDLAPNQPFIEEGRRGLTLRVFSQRGPYRIPTTISETGEGILDVTFSRLRNIPAIVLIKALGLTKESDIAKQIGREEDSIIVNFYEYAKLQTPRDALLFMAENSGVQGTEKEVLDRIKQRIDSYFLPHIGLDKESRIEKAVTLCKLIKQFLSAKENNNLRTDKDHYANKRVKLSGDLLSDLFRVNMNILVKDIQYTLQKVAKRKKFYSVKTVAKSTLFTHRVESAIATGSWIGERSGVTQNMSKNNYLDMLSSLQRVSSMLPGEQENFMARTLHPTHYGRFCPTETPEGTEVGLRKNLALLSQISTAVQFDEKKIVKFFKDIGLNEENGRDVFFNGRFVGLSENPEDFANKVREGRRRGELPWQLGVSSNSPTNSVVISTEVGRVLRPLIVVNKGVSQINDEHLVLLEQDEIKWEDLIKKGIIEYIDASEEEDALVAPEQEDITGDHTHLEIDSIGIFGLVTSLVPFGNHDQSARLNRGSKTLRQSLGIYAANYLVRLDTNLSILHYPQHPIVRSFTYDALNIYPAGQNLVVAVIPYEGYNMEDSVVLNRGSIERGLARSTYFKPYRTTELNYAGGLKDEITIPDKDVSGYRTEESYRFLEDDGIVYPEAELSSNEVVIGRITPPKFLSEAKDISIQSKKEGSISIKQGETGKIDAVFVTADSEGNKIAQVRVRDLRIPEPGDKFSTPHGQKGVVGMLADPKDVPFTSRGVKPDLIFNPHGLPKRMTMGYMIEVLAGKVGAIRGKFIDGTPFSGEKAEDLENQLREMGFDFEGKETMYDGVSGRKMDMKIYIGNMYYLKLGRMVKNLIHARASGKVALLTRQPVEGRSRGGALRLGEMEQQALVGHGASLLLKERYDSDKTTIYICKKCGALGIKDTIRNKMYCPVCSSNEIEPIEVSYAFKLLVEELLGLHILTKFELKNKYE
ncbi:MAG: DNA-directed RNA polymerase subunit B'' [Candidatus Pacearchaeota archaeon]|nr:DNA-directed RNA polymerase subunit B'' [Candidatus Pacearchaeota archaeon]